MQWICARALLVLSLVSIALPASAQVIEGTSNDGAAAAAVVPEGTTGAPPATTSVTLQAPNPRVQTLSLGFAWNSLFFHTENKDNYRFGGPGFALDYYVGRSWGFALHIGTYFPLHGVQTGTNDFSGALAGRYDGGHMGVDTTLMIARRMPLNDKLTLVWGVGVNITTLRLVSSQDSPIELIAGGLGGVARIEYALSSRFFLAGQMTAAVNPIDFIRHTNRAVLSNPVSFGVSVGFRF